MYVTLRFDCHCLHFTLYFISSVARRITDITVWAQRRHENNHNFDPAYFIYGNKNESTKDIYANLDIIIDILYIIRVSK